jgi:RecQ mediated genome instability protein
MSIAAIVHFHTLQRCSVSNEAPTHLVGADSIPNLQCMLNAVDLYLIAMLCCCFALLQSDEHRAEESGKRALKLRLSDGCQDVAAFEFRRLSDLKLADLAVGLKLIVTNPVSAS